MAHTQFLTIPGTVGHIGLNCPDCARRLRRIIQRHERRHSCAQCDYDPNGNCPYYVGLCFARGDVNAAREAAAGGGNGWQICND